MAQPFPEAIPVNPADDGNNAAADPATEWARMTPGQRVSFVNAAALRGLYPVGEVDYYSGAIPSFAPGAPGTSGYSVQQLVNAANNGAQQLAAKVSPQWLLYAALAILGVIGLAAVSGHRHA